MKYTPNDIVTTALKLMLLEQAEPVAQPDQMNTDNADSEAIGLFTPAEERFLGKFDAYGSDTLGVIYSLSETGIREFMQRSGKDLNLTVGMLIKLIKQGVIKVVKYGGLGRDSQYTLKLMLSLDDVKGLGDEDEEKAENDSATGAAGAAGAVVPPAPMVAWVEKYGDVLTEAAKLAVTLSKTTLTESKKSDIEIYTEKSRILKQFSPDFLRDLKRIVEKIHKKSLSGSQQVRLVADILDNLQVNMGLTKENVAQAYQYHREQKKLQKYMDKHK
jgi:hypothetical protein